MQEKMSSMVASSRPLNTGTRAKGRLSRSEAFIQPVDWKKTAGRCGGIRNYDLSYLKWANLEQPLLTPPHQVVQRCTCHVCTCHGLRCRAFVLHYRSTV